jgi:hypothetical protein
MKDLIDYILKYLPQYFTDFGSAFSGPKSFIAAKRVDANDGFGEALLFLGISMVLVLLMFAPLQPAGSDFLSYAGANFVTFLIAVPLGAMAIRVGWWLVGGRASARSFFITYAYYFGVVVVMITAVQLLSLGFFKTFEPQLYQQFIVASQKHQSMPDMSQSYIPGTALVVFIFGYLMISIWALIGWGAFRQLTGVGKLRSFAALIISGVLMLPVTAVIFFVARAVGSL